MQNINEGESEEVLALKTKNDAVYYWIETLQENPANTDGQEYIINHYRGLVESLAYKYSVNHFVHEDLVQVGMIGLFMSIRRFDDRIGKSFEAFAIPTILGEIKRFIRDQTWSVHVPRRIKELGPKIQRSVDQLTVKRQKSPTIKEIAIFLDVSEAEVLETLEMRQSYRALSVDHQVDADGDGGTLSILDTQGEIDDQLTKVNLRIMIESLFPHLTKREQIIIKCIFYREMSQKDTGDYLGISQMHVSRLQRRALDKLKNHLPMSQEEVFDYI